MIDPITREEKYLQSIADGEQTNLKPITRKEVFLAKLAGQDVETPNPITREEIFLSKISAGGDCSSLNALIDGSISNLKSDAATVRAYAFRGTSLERAELTDASSIGGFAFNLCKKLKTVILGRAVEIGSSAFASCEDFRTLVLKSNNVVSLSSTGAFTGTPFATSGAIGEVYVHADLIEQYKQATNWSALYAGGSCEFVPLEGSVYE